MYLTLACGKNFAVTATLNVLRLPVKINNEINDCRLVFIVAVLLLRKIYNFHGSLDPTSPHPNDRISRFRRAHGRTLMKDHATASVAISRIYAVRAMQAEM